jgi:FKBP-type peptidyl-prolyl cis-trans isomerase FklB
MKKSFLILLCAFLCLGTQAAKKTKKGKKADVEKVDTIDSRTFAYLLGYVNTQGLKPYLAQQKGIDTTYMAQFLDGFAVKELTPEDKAAQARIAGTEIRRDVETRILPGISKQLNDSVKVLSDEDFLAGFADALRGTPLAISQDSAMKVVDKQFKYWRGVMMEKKYGANRKAGEDFLKTNAKKDSVQTTASGLQYKVLVAGTGDKPTASDRVKVNYEGRLLDGTVFDSSYKRGEPATFGVSQVIKGWTEALQLMPVGSKWELYIPQELAYGDREQQKIPPYSMLIFTVELIEIVK